MYHQGQGVQQDYTEAVAWYSKAADQGLADAQTSLGVAYLRGQGVPQDYKESVRWYSLAAEQGNAIAQWLLGGMYSSGKGVPPDLVLAHMWLNIASATENDSDRQKKVAESRDKLASLMTTQQIAAAQGLARKCIANKFKGCQRK